MKKRTLKERILAYYQANPGVRIPSGEIQRLVTAKTTYTAANATRRLRELAEDGFLEVEYVRGHAVYMYQAPAFKEARRIEIRDGRAVEIIELVANE